MTERDGTRSAFPWDEAMAFGFGRLRLAPRDFWSMTPHELAAAMSSFTAPASAPERAELMRLMKRFPDIEKGDGTHG